LRFDWHTADWNLNVPFVKTLFHQLASPSQLQPLGLVEVLDWTAATLNRVDANVFTAKFNDADAVQYFYEPFLEAFDPELRKELGVWYTPTEVITYMVAWSCRRACLGTGVRARPMLRHRRLSRRSLEAHRCNPR
jgi:hypothetical protein